MRLSLIEPDPLLRYAPAARRWIVLGMAVGIVLGAVVHALTPPSWTATVAVELTDVSPMVDLQGSGFTPDELSIDTDAQILAADGVVATVAQQTGESEADVREDLAVSARPLTTILEVSYSHHAPSTALRGADAAAAAFLRERQRLIISPLQSQLAQIIALTEDPGLTADLLQDDGIGVSDAVPSLEIRRQLATSLQLELSSAGRVLEQARLTASADRGDIEVPLTSGAALGGLFGFGLGLLRARLLNAARR